MADIFALLRPDVISSHQDNGRVIMENSVQ